jgi:MFS family permease
MPRLLRPEVGLLVVGLGTLVAPLDTAVNIAFPRMTEAFALGLEGIRWVVIAYVLTYASLMLVCGRLGDLVGYRAIFQLGLALSVLGLVSCAIAPNYALLLLGRILQGIGIALTLSCGPALATSLLGEQGRTRALAFYAGVMAAGAVIGPLAGGLLVAQWGWPSVFWFRVPLPLLALAFSGFLAAAPKQHPVRGFDFPGAVLLVAWMSALLLAVAMLRGPFTPAVPYGLALLGLLSFAAFLVWEARCQQPLIRLSLFRNPAFVIFNAASIAANLAAFGVLLLVPYFLLRVARLDATSGGAVLALAAVGTMLGAWAAGRLAPRVSLERLALAGIALNIAGLWKVSTFAQESPLATVGLSLLVQGLGVGLFQVGYTDYVARILPLSDRGVAGSLAMVTRTIGIVLGATVLSAVSAHFEAAAKAADVAAVDAFLVGFQSTFRYTAVGLALYLALSLLSARTWRAQT